MIFNIKKRKKKYWVLYEDGESIEFEFLNDEAAYKHINRKNQSMRIIKITNQRTKKQLFPHDFIELEKKVDKLRIVSNCAICKHCKYNKKKGWYCKAFPKGIDSFRLSFICDSTLRNKVCNNGIKYEIDEDGIK